jgi:hypothetical protein
MCNIYQNQSISVEAGVRFARAQEAFAALLLDNFFYALALYTHTL